MLRSFFAHQLLNSKRGSVVLVLLTVTLVALSSSVSAVPVVHPNNHQLRRSRQLLDATTNIDVPFYVKEDNQGNLVAVIQYGSVQDDQDKEETETEILVPCSSDLSSSSKSSTGPGVVLCQDLGEGHYQLLLPFRFERDADGVIVSVIFDDTVQTIPFHVNRDQDGSVVGVTSDTEDLTIPFYLRINPDDGTITEVVYIAPTDEDRQEQKSSDFGIVGIVVASVVVAVLLLGLLFVMHSFWCGLGCRSRKNDPEIGEDAVRTSASKLDGEEAHETETLASDNEDEGNNNINIKLDE